MLAARQQPGVRQRVLLRVALVRRAGDELIEVGRQRQFHVGLIGEHEKGIHNFLAPRLLGDVPAESQVGALDLTAVGGVNRLGRPRPAGRALCPLMGNPHFPLPGRLVAIGELVLADDHLGQRHHGHLQIVDRRQPLKPGVAGKLATEQILEALRSPVREEIVFYAFPRGVYPRGHPLLAVVGDLQHSAVAFRFKFCADEIVGAFYGPDDRARLAFFGSKPVGAADDVLDRGCALLPDVVAEVRPVFPEAVADGVGVVGLLRRPPTIFGRSKVAPPPDQSLARTERHVHGPRRVAGTVATDRVFVDEHGRIHLIEAACVGHREAVGVGPFDQIMVAGNFTVAGHRLVVAQQEEAFQVAVHQVPAAVVLHLGDGVRHQASRGALQSQLLPIKGRDLGVLSADVVSVDVEDQHWVREAAAVAAAVEAARDVLQPHRDGLFLVGHPRGDGRGHDLVEVAEVVAPVGEPGIDKVGLADVLHPHGAVGLPALVDDGFPVDAAAYRRAAALAIDGAAVDDDVFVRGGGDVLDVALSDVGGQGLGRPRRQGCAGPGFLGEKHGGGNREEEHPNHAERSDRHDNISFSKCSPGGDTLSIHKIHSMPLRPAVKGKPTFLR